MYFTCNVTADDFFFSSQQTTLENTQKGKLAVAINSSFLFPLLNICTCFAISVIAITVIPTVCKLSLMSSAIGDECVDPFTTEHIYKS